MFPSTTPSFTSPTSSQTLAAAGHTALHLAEEANIIAFSNKIGTGASTPTSGVALVGTGVGTSAWQQLPLSTGVSGVLGVANGGTGVGTSTGTGAVVLGTAPTISGATLSNPVITGGTQSSPAINTPTLNSPIISNWASATGIPFSSLLSTIFSGQVQTQANAGSAGGNMWWINLGGIKLLWGQTGSMSYSGTGAQFTITFPTFFNTLQSYTMGQGGAGGTYGQKVEFQTNYPSISGANLQINNLGSGSSSIYVGYLMMGT